MSLSIVDVVDDRPDFTGSIASGGLTNDANPLVRVSLTGAGLAAGDSLQLMANGAALGAAQALTEAQVAAGYVDVAAAAIADGTVALTAVATPASGGSGVTSPAYDLRVDTVGPYNNDVSAVYSDTGLVAKYGVTNDRILLAQTNFPTNPAAGYAPAAGDTVRFIIDGGYYGAPITLTQADIDRGSLSVTSPELSYGDHWFRVELKDAAGNPSGQANAYFFTVSQKLPPQITAVTDDAAPQVGNVPDGGFTNDPVLTARISLADTLAKAGDKLTLTAQGQTTEVTLTAANVSTGYVDLNTPALAMSTSGREGMTALTSQIRYADGRAGLTDVHYVRVDTQAPNAPVLAGAQDDAGPTTGALASGATTDDSTPTFTLTVDSDPGAAWYPPPPPPSGSPGHPQPPPHYSSTYGEPVTLYANGQAVGSANVSGSQMTITTSPLQPGAYTFTAKATDKAGYTSDVSAPFTLTVVASDGSGSSPGSGQVITSDQYGDALVGGAGADTLNAGQGPDVLTGNGGGDAFVFAKLPWNAGHVTDFAVGTDRLDLSAIFQASGYAGSDPVADGRMTLQSDGAGGTKVYFDHDATNGGDWPFLITTLDQVSPTGLTWAQLSAGTGGTSGPPPGGGSGQVINSPGPGSTLTGGAGDDTLNASQGQDQLTGAGGADHFVWRNLPWNAGHVTDFVSGQDKLDLRPLFQASSYSGSDPIADRWLEFRPDGAGNTQVYVDHDGPDTGDWPFLITTLDGVAPGRIAASDWIFR